MTRVCFVLNNIGDYHAARLAHCSRALAARFAHLTAVEASPQSSFYLHRQTRSQSLMAGVDNHRLVENGRDWSVVRLWRILASARPTHIFTIGYSDKLSAATLAYAKTRGIRSFFLADSKADDQSRSWTREWIKSRVVNRFDGALVAGDRHRCYFRSLGMRGRIEIGYDVIDNGFFKEQAARLRRKVPLMRRLQLIPDRYVLCVSRFVDRKRIDLVLKIFAESGAAAMGVNLVLIGSGPNDAAIHAQIKVMGIQESVWHFRDVKNAMMPAFYSQAEVLILASDYDQWGLCVNEAMTLGVPCIVSDRCGVAGEIVIEGVTGFVFPSGYIKKAVADLRRLLIEPTSRTGISQAALGMLDRWDLDRFTDSIMRLVQTDAKAA